MKNLLVLLVFLIINIYCVKIYSKDFWQQTNGSVVRTGSDKVIFAETLLEASPKKEV